VQSSMSDPLCGISKDPCLTLKNLRIGKKAYYVHLDVDRSQLLKAKAVNRKSDFLFADAKHLPLKNDSFDLVFASEIFG
jgi:ubiquinone/menaquinone biosynthesis C-methylase UbiE